MIFHTKTPEETQEIGKKIGEKLLGGEILALQGSLAAGKTVFTKGIALALGIDENVTSPTFCLISEYQGRLKLFHLDVYRLSGTEEFEDLGTDDFMYGNAVTVIEWSEKIMEILPKSTIVIKIEAKENGERVISIDNWTGDEILV